MDDLVDLICCRIHERLVGEISGFVAFPDDVDEWVMPIVREELRMPAIEILRRAGP